MTLLPMLLVAGPSGGGKSTFLRLLAEGALAPEILQRMPKPTAEWPLIELNDVLKGAISNKILPAEAPGVLAHYDIVLIHRYHLSRYEDDPALKILDQAQPLHVVFIRPDSVVVRDQFLARQMHHRKTKSAISLWWSRYFRLPLRRLFSPVTGKPTRSTEDLYQDDNWLAGCYRQWETFVHRLVEKHPNAQLTVIEPAPHSDGPPAFRLASSSTPDPS